MSEIIFEVREDEVDGGYTAAALGYGIHTQGDTLEELRAMVKEAVNCYFEEGQSLNLPHTCCWGSTRKGMVGTHALVSAQLQQRAD